MIDLLQDKRVILLALITLLSIGWVFYNGGPFNGGLKFGIDFSGGVRVPILLDEPVDPVTMQEMVDNIKTRASTFALSEVRVTPVGDSQIDVEVAQTNPQLINDIEKILSRQGIYQGVIDGQVAVSGDGIFQDTVQRGNPTYYPGSDWVVEFSLTNDGQRHFSQVVRGKGNYPLYMFLDRPKDAVLVLSDADLMASVRNDSRLSNVSDQDAVKSVLDATTLQDANILLVMEKDALPQLQNGELKPQSNDTHAIVSNASDPALISALKAAGFAVDVKTPDQMQPEFILTSSNVPLVVNRWDAIGLKSAPILSPSLSNGLPSSTYVITGAAKGSGQAKLEDADFSSREMISVLKGGALPVQISLGSVQQVPAVLGQQVLDLSLLGLVFAVICISVFVAIRYRTIEIVLPIVLTSVAEMIILIAVIGSFSIDLAAMAGIIAAVGISVDAQIIITDELIKTHGEDAQEELKKAFNIIVTNAVIAIIALAPLLLFSGLVEIIGFATTTVIGYLLGVFISRPAYAAVANVVISGHRKSAAARAPPSA